MRVTGLAAALLSLWAASGCRDVLGIEPVPPGMMQPPIEHSSDACTPGSDGCDAECDACADSACSDGGCPAGKEGCSPGERRCGSAAKQLESCSDAGDWQPMECADACDEDAAGGASCSGECQPAASECVADGAARRACGTDARWGSPTACEFGCVNGACRDCEPLRTECVDGNTQLRSCAPGAVLCENGERRVCGDDGEWGPSMDCPLGCSGTECNECSPNSNQCAGDTAERTCSAAGRWGPVSTCENGCFADRCGDCRPGSTRCASGRFETCSGVGQWDAGTACEHGCTGDGAACAECTNDDVECPTSSTLRVCAAGAWSAVRNCRVDSTCDPSAIAGGNTCPCLPGFVDPHPVPGLCAVP